MLQTENTVSSKGVRRMFGLGLVFWNNAMLVGLGGAALFAVLVLLSTYAVIKLQDQEATDRADDFARYKLEASGKIAGANARAVEAQLALEQYKAPRALTEAQFATLVAELKPFAGQYVLVGRYPDVAESANFAKQLEGAFVASGWKLADPYFPGLAAGTAGIFVRVDERNPEAPRAAAETVAKALAGFGITAVAPKGGLPDALFLFGGDRANQVGVEVGTKF